MVNEKPMTQAEEQTFGHNTPQLLELLDKTLLQFSKDHDGLDALAVVAALSYLLCHTAYHMVDMPKELVLLGVHDNYEHFEETFGRKGEAAVQ